jgi:chain length determinant protein tyrosine kinase EpsG
MRGFPPFPAAHAAGAEVHDRPIGELLHEQRPLSAEQVQRILVHQRRHGLRFGEAAIALRLATDEDVRLALARQAHVGDPQAAEPGADDLSLSPELVVAHDPLSAAAEAVRELRGQLLASLEADTERRALSIVSPDVGDGKTYLAANLAVAFSQLGQRTLLVDANLHTPRLHRVFDVENTAGVGALLGEGLETSVIQHAPRLPGLYILPAGVAAPGALRRAPRSLLCGRMRELATAFDHVVVDTTAACHGPDARIVATVCGAVLVLARTGCSRVRGLQALADELATGSTLMAGVVINDY